MKTKRDSSIELLRILAMLMMVFYHIYCHAISEQLSNPEFIARMNTGELFCYPVFFSKLLLLASTAPIGKIGDAIFIIISGYFMASKGPDIDLMKISKKLLTQQLFAVLLLTVLSTAVWQIAGSGTYVSLFSFNQYNTVSWFIGYYFLLMVMASLFLNSFLEKLDRKQYITFLLVMLAITQFSWPVSIFGSLAFGLNTQITGVFLYSLGGGMKRFGFFEKLRWPVLLLVILFSVLLVNLSAYNSIHLDIENYHRNNSSELFIQNIPYYEDNSIICIAVGAAVFEMFRRMRIGYSRVINYLASATLMVYLLHDNRFAYSIWNTQDWITLLHDNPSLLIAKQLLWAMLTFLIGVAAYSLYGLLGKLFFRIIHREEAEKSN